MLGRDEVQRHRDRLLALADPVRPPHNIKRRSAPAAKTSARPDLSLFSRSSTKSTSKMTVQDYVRADPGYTPNIEHLVFPKRGEVPPPPAPKPRSRLAEMFALSRHLQQRSADRDVKQTKPSPPALNRSIDSVGLLRTSSGYSGSGSGGGISSISGVCSGGGGASLDNGPRCWSSVGGGGCPRPRAPMPAPSVDSERLAASRHQNVSILHLRSTSEPWERDQSRQIGTKVYSSTRCSPSGHQMLGTSSKPPSGELYVDTTGQYGRELSPVRWCDREVDGVYLGKSGWVQVQQRSLDENRRVYEIPKTVVTLPQARRVGIKLADYHCNSEPARYMEPVTRPAYLALHNQVPRIPSPQSVPESYSPPSLTPIISPPPAFQDKNSKSNSRSRYYYGTKPFLPRSNAIDTDIISPPASPPPPPINWSTLPRTPPQQLLNPKPRQKLTPSPVSNAALLNKHRLPQTKSLEDTTPSRRTQFLQKYIESSSSSSSTSFGFRSLDSCVSRPAMPRLAENTDSSIEGYEDGDEDDISSSINLSMVSALVNSSPDSMNGLWPREREKISPSGRQTRNSYYRGQSRKSPGSSDKSLMCSSPSSSSSCSPPGRSPSGTMLLRRGVSNRQHPSVRQVPPPVDPNAQRVKRSRSLQLPEKRSPGSSGGSRDGSYPMRVSPMQGVEPPKMTSTKSTSTETRRRQNVQHSGSQTHSFEPDLDEDLLREAEVITEYLNSNRSRAAAQALLFHRYYEKKEEMPKEPPRVPVDNGYSVVFVPPAGYQRQKVLQRGSTAPTISTTAGGYIISPTKETVTPPSTIMNPCNSTTCDFWPHCAHRETLNSNIKIPVNYQRLSPSDMRANESRSNRSTPEDQDIYKKNRLGNSYSISGSRTPEPRSGSRRGIISENGFEKTIERDRCGDVIVINDRECIPRIPEPPRVTEPRRQTSTKREVGVDRGPSLKTSPVNIKSVSPVPMKNVSPVNVKNISPVNMKSVSPIKTSVSPSAVGNSISTSSSSSDVWVTTSDRTATKSPRNPKSSGTSTPLDLEDTTTSSQRSIVEPQVREMILTRPGSAPADAKVLAHTSTSGDLQQRSMSLPKSFLSRAYRQGTMMCPFVKKQSRSSDRSTESSSSSVVPILTTDLSRGGTDYRHSWHFPDNEENVLSESETFVRVRGNVSCSKINEISRRSKNETSLLVPRRQNTECSTSATPSPARRRRLFRHDAAVHTAPVTPSHEHAGVQSSSGSTRTSRRSLKASSTPHLTEDNQDIQDQALRNRSQVSTLEHVDSAIEASPLHTRLTSHYQQSHRTNIGSNTSESVLAKFRKTFSLKFQKKSSKECSAQSSLECDNPMIFSIDDTVSNEPQGVAIASEKDETGDQKYRFGPLTWRGSRERRRKGSSKVAREAKCNSGDSGIHVEMGGSGNGVGCGGGDSSDTAHDTDPLGDEADSSPQVVRRRRHTGQTPGSRPHSDLINQILIDKFKADLQALNARRERTHVRRAHSDLGAGRRLQRRGAALVAAQQRVAASANSTSMADDDVTRRAQLRTARPTRVAGHRLRRSLSQPVDIDKLSPLMRLKNNKFRTQGPQVFSEDEHEGTGAIADDGSDSECGSLGSTTGVLAEAVWDHVAMESEELAFRAGDVIEVLETVDKNWWWGTTTDGRVGWFPSAFVRLRVNQEEDGEDEDEAVDKVPSPRRSPEPSKAVINKRISIRRRSGFADSDQIRTRVVAELVQTERDFVRLLGDVRDGYLVECCRRTDLFTDDQVQAIFANLEQLLEFQTIFLNDLETCIDWDHPQKSCVAECFLKHRSGFRLYSDYCNGQPLAVATLQDLIRGPGGVRYVRFLEACRLMRGLPPLPLDGYLLTPVQRICKYPLQLAELLKHTTNQHPDRENLVSALEAMRGVALLVNERKRRLESIEKLALWQNRVENWVGPDLTEISSHLVHSGEAIRITPTKSTSVTLFLFDHQLVYCKKDILKRNVYIYKGRICLDTSEVVDIPDGKEPQLGSTVRNAIRIQPVEKEEEENSGEDRIISIVFCCRTAEDKVRWLSALEEERRLVARDIRDGLDLPPAARQLARLAARSHPRPPESHGGNFYGKPRSDGKSYNKQRYGSSATHQEHTSVGRKVGGWWFTSFGGHKKTRAQPS